MGMGRGSERRWGFGAQNMAGQRHGMVFDWVYERKKSKKRRERGGHNSLFLKYLSVSGILIRYGMVWYSVGFIGDVIFSSSKFLYFTFLPHDLKKLVITTPSLCVQYSASASASSFSSPCTSALSSAWRGMCSCVLGKPRGRKKGALSSFWW